MIDANVQDLLVSDKLLLHSALVHYKLPQMLHVLS
jgi:hypothetical protein